MKRRKIFSALTSAAMCLSLLSGQTAAQVTAAGTATGDVNDDGNVTISDISTLIDYLLENNPQPFNLANADVNGSGNITIGDVTALIDILLGAH